jgi:hypothetical protein
MEKDPSRRYQSAGEMMQHCQQVFAELNSGNVAVGAGGVPRTMIAPNPQALMGGQPMPGQMPGQPVGFPPPQQSGLAPQQGGYQQSAPQAKTMIAQSPFQQGGNPMMPQPGMQPGGPQPPQGGYVQASAAQKTIVAGMAPPIMGGQLMQPGMQPPGMQPPGMAPQGTPGGGFPPQGAGPSGPNKTVMLQPSEGVVSVARTGGAVAAAVPGMSMTGAMVQQGASTLFWIVSLATGVAVGVIAYLIVCHL